MSKVSVFLSRAATVIVDDVEHKLQAGRQMLDKAVADHWMVKHLSTDAPTHDVDSQVADLTDKNTLLETRAAAAQAQVVELTSKLAEVQAKALADANAAGAALTTYSERATADAAKIAELEAQVAEFLATPAADANTAAGNKKAK